MTTDEIEIKLDKIRIAAAQADEERAHSLEDSLYQEFVQWVATDEDTPPWIVALAESILQSKKIEFARHCA